MPVYQIATRAHESRDPVPTPVIRRTKAEPQPCAAARRTRLTPVPGAPIERGRNNGRAERSDAQGEEREARGTAGARGTNAQIRARIKMAARRANRESTPVNA